MAGIKPLPRKSTSRCITRKVIVCNDGEMQLAKNFTAAKGEGMAFHAVHCAVELHPRPDELVNYAGHFSPSFVQRRANCDP